MTSRSYCLADLKKENDFRDVVTAVDLVRETGRIGRMSYDYLADTPPAFWDFDKAHFIRFEEAVDEASKARVAKTEQDRILGQFKNVL